MVFSHTPLIWIMIIGLRVRLSCHSGFNGGSISFLDEILQSVLPEDIRQGCPTGFATVGHVGTSLAHF
jgi:hypothetical protein